MVEVSIVASGTRGDVQPYIALGQGLSSAGYDVRLLASENFEPLAVEAGLSFCSTGESIETILQSDEWRAVTESGNFLRILRQMQREMKKRVNQLAQQLPGFLEGSDLIITGMSGLGGVFTIAEAFKIPLIQAYVVPFSPTRELAAPLVAKLPFGRLLNRPSFHLMRQMFWQTSKMSDTATRQILGLPKGSFWGPYRSLKQRRVPALYGYSQHVLPRPTDWTDNEMITGYWFLDEPEGWQPPADLVAFLNAGQAPVYIGFGSMGSRDPQEAGTIAVEALQRTGQRGVLAAGWGGLKASEVPETIHLIESLPHSWLFPRMAAVVHHGGAGTTAAGLRAGVPSVIIPFMGDQPFWGRRVAELGVGPAPIPRKKLTAPRLAAAISEAVNQQDMRAKANRLGQQIQAEAGVANAAAFILRFMQRLT
jgi:sterol 3beta-glucosyltransferase